MKGYSWSKEDYLDLLIKKYKMELTYIYWADCSKCHTLRPHVEKWCSENGYNFVAMEYADSWMEISSIPMAIINKDWKEEILDYDGIVALVSNSK